MSELCTTKVNLIYLFLWVHMPRVNFVGWNTYWDRQFSSSWSASILDWGNPYINFNILTKTYPSLNFISTFYSCIISCGIVFNGFIYILGVALVYSRGKKSIYCHGYFPCTGYFAVEKYLDCCDVCHFCGDFSRVVFYVSSYHDAALVFFFFLYPIIAAESCMCDLVITWDLM